MEDFPDMYQGKDPEDIESFQGERRKVIQPTSLKDPKLEKLKTVLVDWINSTLKEEHIVVRSLEEDIFDGLILHHLLGRLAGVLLSVEEIAVTSAAQTRKLEVILEALNEKLGLQDSSLSRWSVKLIHNKDLLATLHLLVAMVRCFQPNLELPPNVRVEVVLLEVNRSGIKSEKEIEILTDESDSTTDSLSSSDSEDPIEQLLKLEPHKINTVKRAILHFVNKKMSTLGLQVTDMEKQFSDGVILLLLIGQLEGFFVPLYDFNITPINTTEMLQNVTVALDLLNDIGLPTTNIEPQDIVSQDVTTTLKVLYALFKKHKSR
ncbi:gamma-parvin isoform X1 [Salmo salar]|uniref:Gamma-parvin n=2 Tax=Salmo TaxID=8028 RepID=A0A1S3KMK6_SALSA|nr:gamma-parvin isoform X1 [Salmo salar]XP_013979956.1 gamma-parvin isoform X1 [Salmo salar]XP_013979958.1 gamma-parvin isoform X1 [Salmo salar]XP_029613884.1 gamma-parvin [Salmo trutta]XP_029613885.1 gamma-parvin [Salmo trutta]XP_029613886.1 gamma-parvin [Salmo trutta]XP_029613887.1 gamma-parvin [Salmo trutta]|eukprot:XP_013979955.1 PREDICTED: gamma-parvin [Salmo salar]